MRARDVAWQAARRLTRRYPFLRRISLASTLLTLVWLVVIHHGERATFAAHIDACRWERWENWPRDAVPHHLTFIADPQLVDPHTYPGRPWPLSRLTEVYTDHYMARNFRIINDQLDPDSVVFLGDLFDGGREWATETARPLGARPRKVMEDYALIPKGGKERERTKFVPGEGGRWARWSDWQWKTDLARFTNIFFHPEQLYPKPDREFLPDALVSTHPVSVENGAALASTHEYAVLGSKQRKVMASLPGNHDLGFGSGVQAVVRERFETHFGASNNIYVLGNHTFVSIDTPSLSAYDESVVDGEMTEARRAKYKDTWSPAHDFLQDLSRTSPKVVGEHLNNYYPNAHLQDGQWHQAIDVHDNTHLAAAERIKTGSRRPQLPVILLSHVPLYRNADTDCGKLREKGRSISISRGYQYQNVLTPTLSQMLVQKVSVAGDVEYVFTGDDHDYCDVSHRFNVERQNEESGKSSIVMRSVRDITVKSFSWAMGVRRPGFLLVSLWNPVDDMGKPVGTPLPTIQTQLCLLPDQLSVFISYARLCGLTLVVLLVRAIIEGFRNKPAAEDDDEYAEGLPRLSLPRYQDQKKANGRANGYSSPKKQNNESKGRQRASSTSTSTSSGNNNNLGVQRSYNARTRSVSPAAATGGLYYSPNSSHYALPNLSQQNGTLIEKAGYYPQLRWQDPEESDEESHVGEEQDSQAKWNKPKKAPSKARRILDELLVSLTHVAIPAGLFYGFLIRNG